MTKKKKPVRDTCRVCAKDIQVQINKGSGYCSENCKKKGK